MPADLDSVAPEHRHALAIAGYSWKPETGVWVNHTLGRAISHETVRNHDATWLKRWLAQGLVS